MTITAGKLRLRLYIEGQWNDLIRKITAGEGELNRLVPFQMTPFQIGDAENIVSVRTVEARSIPGLSKDSALRGTPLWSSEEPTLGMPEVNRRGGEGPSDPSHGESENTETPPSSSSL